MSHSVFVHYIFNILLLLLLLIGFLYPMPFIYKDTKKKHVCNFNNISPSFNIQSYFINSLNQKYFLNISFLPQFLQGKITQHSSGYNKGQPHNSVLQFLKVKQTLEYCLECHKKADLADVKKNRSQSLKPHLLLSFLNYFLRSCRRRRNLFVRQGQIRMVDTTMPWMTWQQEAWLVWWLLFVCTSSLPL